MRLIIEDSYQKGSEWAARYIAGKIKANEETDATLSSPEHQYLRPTSRTQNNNQLYDGYRWHNAYYLCPIGVNDMRYSSPDTDVATAYLYQNPFWPDEAGSPEE